MTSTRSPLLELRALTVEYGLGPRRAPVRAVDGVDLAIATGETLGLVGESGSGKTTVGKAVLGLCSIADGAIVFAGRDITRANHFQRRALSLALQVVFQDPHSSLNPARTIGQTLSATFSVHETLPQRKLDQRVSEALERVGLSASAAKRYPISFSGGQLQRIAIARALIVRPRLIVCDEPVSSLDLSIQAQVLNLLADLQDEFHFSYLLIAHDLDVVQHLSHHIAVMYRGQIVETGDTTSIHDEPKHPYTRMLLAAAPVPNIDEQRRRRNARVGEHATTVAPTHGAGCPFAPRCTHSTDVCHVVRPALERTPADTRVACHHWRDLDG